ncbi:hypothetical protein [Nocardioides plantarum]|uniref:Uncharacterized protein n=1 Tax=Nocardioides plantarum TaxID=29299 RepID=A0ABV5K810_9ACTN|nr:hypothetical protein [Nocardioides plantarum]
MNLRPAFLVVSLTAGLLLAGGPAAHAETWRHVDKAGDAVVTDHRLDGTATRPAVLRSEKRGDITAETVTFTRDRVQVAMGARSLEEYDVSATLKVVTSRGDSYTLGYLDNDNTVGESKIFVQRNGYRYTCDGIAASRTRAGLLFRMPTSCLDTPYKIRVGLQTRIYTTPFDDVNEREIRDDAYRTGKVDVKKSKLSPWILGG